MIKKSLALAIIFGISSYAYAEKSVIGLNADMTSVGKTRSELKINSSNVFDDDKNRYAFKNMSEFFPSKTISKGTEKEYIFNKVLINDIIDNLPFEYTNKVENKKTKTTIKDMLYNTRTDAFIVLKDGDIVYEQYFDGQDETTRHQMMSVSKSLTGMLAASLVSEGKLDPQAKVSTYIPDLKNSGYGNATVQQVLDMLVEIKYSEDYADPEAEVNNYKAALGFGEFSANYEGEKNIKGFLETLQGVSIGDKFQYATPSTDVMCWLVESATNTPIEKLMYDRI